MDYMMNPVICTIWCAKAAVNFAPATPYAAWAIFFALLFTALNLRGIQATARISQGLVLVMTVVIVVFLVAVARYVSGLAGVTPGFFARPFYDPSTFSFRAVATGTSMAGVGDYFHYYSRRYGAGPSGEWYFGPARRQGAAGPRRVS